MEKSDTFLGCFFFFSFKALQRKRQQWADDGNSLGRGKQECLSEWGCWGSSGVLGFIRSTGVQSLEQGVDSGHLDFLFNFSQVMGFLWALGTF